MSCPLSGGPSQAGRCGSLRVVGNGSTITSATEDQEGAMNCLRISVRLSVIATAASMFAFPSWLSTVGMARLKAGTLLPAASTLRAQTPDPQDVAEGMRI